MTTWRQGDEERTKEVLEGKRPATENGKTWLRHKEGTSCYIIDLEILKGMSSVEEIAEIARCPISRVNAHRDHLQERKDREIVPHRLKIHSINGKLMFGKNGF